MSKKSSPRRPPNSRYYRLGRGYKDAQHTYQERLDLEKLLIDMDADDDTLHPWLTDIKEYAQMLTSTGDLPCTTRHPVLGKLLKCEVCRKMHLQRVRYQNSL